MTHRVIPETGKNEIRVHGWGVSNSGEKITPMWMNKPAVGPEDVKFDIHFCGVCYSDVYHAELDLERAIYPMVPGHEMAGIVTEIGGQVTKFAVGDRVGVGTFVDSCKLCQYCNDGDEQYCANGRTRTYNGVKQHGRVGGNLNTQTFGGYSTTQVTHQDFIIKFPDSVPLDKAGPLLCAGITMYDPLRTWGATNKSKMVIGIVGIGGLGTMGIKLAKALGHTVVAISTSVAKEKMAKEKQADVFVCSTDPESLAANVGTCDLILNTVSAPHELMTYVPLLRTKGTLVQLGLVKKPHTISQLPLLIGRKSIAGSVVGGITATQECVDLCARNNIFPDINVIEASELDKTWQALLAGNADGARFVLDIKKSMANKAFLTA